MQSAQQGILACKGDAGCLCRTDIVNSTRAAQQCMFEQLIATDSKPADPRVGSNALLAGELFSWARPRCLIDCSIFCELQGRCKYQSGCRCEQSSIAFRLGWTAGRCFAAGRNGVCSWNWRSAWDLRTAGSE